MGLLTRFSPSHIAQFCRDWIAMLGYRSADQNGGSARGYLGDLSHRLRSGIVGYNAIIASVPWISMQAWRVRNLLICPQTRVGSKS
jgi:hypothetical protein